MAKGMCFIIAKCAKNKKLIDDVKDILGKNNFAYHLAEDRPFLNTELLIDNVLEPLNRSDLVIVILQPKKPKYKDANFNVSFEYGYALAIGKPVYLLFGGDISKLPSDIRGRVAISLKKGWGKKLFRELKKPNLLSSSLINLENVIITLMKNGIKDKDYKEFADLLLEFSNGFIIANNDEVFDLIKKVLTTPENYDIRNGDEANQLLMALNNILRNEREASKKFHPIFLTELPRILTSDAQNDIMKNTLRLLMKIDDEKSFDEIVSFIEEKSVSRINDIFAPNTFNFQIDSSPYFCAKLLSRLSEKTFDHAEKKGVVKNLKKSLINALKTQYTTKGNNI